MKCLKAILQIGVITDGEMHNKENFIGVLKTFERDNWVYFSCHNIHLIDLRSQAPIYTTKERSLGDLC